MDNPRIPRIYDDAEMPGHERDQHDAEILESLRKTMLDPDGSYVVVCIYPNPDADTEDDDAFACDAVVVLAGETTLHRLAMHAMIVDTARDRLQAAADSVVRNALLRKRPRHDTDA